MRGSPVLFEDVAGVILVGGRSNRLGCDKVLLYLNGTPVLQHLRDLLAPLVSEILLVGHRRPEFDTFGLRSVEDIMPDTGPLGGICSALMRTTAPFVFVAAGDMPFLTSSLVTAIVQSRGDADAVVPLGPRGLEPLCAVYSRSCTGPLCTSLERGNRRIVTALEGLKVLTPEITVADGERDPFFNVNYPEDLEDLTEN